jgi:MFS family permease
MLTIFNFDTIVELKNANKIDGPSGLIEVLNKIYTTDDEVNRVVTSLVVSKAMNLPVLANPRSNDLSWKDTFCNPKYRQAALMGVLVCANQHLNGMIGIIFYSSLIFEKVGVSVMAGNFIILFANLFGTIPGFFLLKYVGRRPLLLWTMASVSFLYVIMSLAAIHDQPLILLVATSIVLFVLEIAVLPLGFLYINEACNYKALSIGVGANWFLLVLTGIGTGPLFAHKTLGPYAFLMFSGSNAVVLIILTLFMKETKDLSE